MIDLHCHLLPGVDDGAPDLETSLAMARMAVSDGITITACTPHIYPGVHENTGNSIRAAVRQLQREFDAAAIPLRLVEGADVHVAPELVQKLGAGEAATLAGSRYFLLEPPHHVPPPHFRGFVFSLLAEGYVPLITHPERLGWIGSHYAMFSELVRQGAWIQLTAGSLTGRFGGKVRYWAERMLEEGLVHILATDAHGTGNRAPRLSEGREAAERLVGIEEAWHLVQTRPEGILGNLDPAAMPPLPQSSVRQSRKTAFWRKLLGRQRKIR